MSTKLLNRILSTTLSRIKFPRLNIVSSFSFKRLTLNSANQLSYQPIISKYSISTSLVRNAEVQKQCLDLSEELKTYEIEQILNLMTSDKKHDLNQTHLIICMKRFYALYMDGDFDFKWNIRKDPRLEKFSDQLLIAAPNMSTPDIVFILKLSQNLWRPDSHLYALLKLCTNVIGDLSAQDIANLTETMISITDELEYYRCDYMEYETPEKMKPIIEWDLKLTNQIEVMMKCLLLLAKSKDHQFRNVNVKSRVDLLLAFGNNLNSVNSLLTLMLEDFNDFLEHPEQLVKAISALLICLSSYPTLSPPPISSTPKMFPSFMNLKFYRFKDVLLSNNNNIKDRLLKDIRVDDEYDKFCEGFEKLLLRTNKDKSMESQKSEHENRIILLTQLLNKTVEAFHRLEEPFEFKIDNIDNREMLLTACTEFILSNPTNGSGLISQCFDLIEVILNKKWYRIDSIVKNFYKFAKMRYYPKQLLTYFDRCYYDLTVSDSNENPDFFMLSSYAIEEIYGISECITADNIRGYPFDYGSGDDYFLYYLENAEHISKHDLDFKMKFVSYMIMKNKEIIKIISVDSIFKELQSNLDQYESDESKINNALMFLTSIENSTEHSSYLPLINELKNKIRPNNEFVDKMINKLWPGRVKRSPSAFNGYIIDLPSSDTNVNKWPNNEFIDKMINKLWPGRVKRSPSAFKGYIIDLPSSDTNVGKCKKLHVTFHYDDSFWRNTGTLRPLWHHAEKMLQCRGYHVVPINVSKLLQMPDAEEYLKYSVEHSEDFYVKEGGYADII